MEEAVCDSEAVVSAFGGWIDENDGHAWQKSQHAQAKGALGRANECVVQVTEGKVKGRASEANRAKPVSNT